MAVKSSKENKKTRSVNTTRSADGRLGHFENKHTARLIDK